MVGGGCLHVRIKKELKYIEESKKYEIINFNEENCELDLIHKLDEAKIKIKLNKYPLEKPIIIINDLIMSQRILEPWNLHERNKNDKNDKNDIVYNLKLILRTINKYFPDNVNNDNKKIKYNKKVLILCHNKKVTGTFKPSLKLEKFEKYCNTDFNSFNELFEKYHLDGIPKFETVDIIPGGTYIEDAFSTTFIGKHIEEYDLLMVPDCAGPWENLISETIPNKHNFFLVERVLEPHEINANKTKLIELCLELTKMVKPGGIIQFGKFVSETPCTIYGKEYSKFSEALISVLETNGFKTETKILEKSGLGLNIIAVKPQI